MILFAGDINKPVRRHDKKLQYSVESVILSSYRFKLFDLVITHM